MRVFSTLGLRLLTGLAGVSCVGAGGCLGPPLPYSTLPESAQSDCSSRRSTAESCLTSIISYFVPTPVAFSLHVFCLTFQSQDQHAGTDHEYAQPFANRWPLVKEQHCEDGHEHKAQLIDRGHLRSVTNFQSPEVADP